MASEDVTRTLSDTGAASPSAPPAALTDDPEKYQVDRVIGRGGMGVVMAARGLRLGRPVAIKEILADDDGLRERFAYEARVTARLQHPSIVPVYSIGHGDGGRPFYVMKHVAGQPLDQVIAGASTLAARLALLPNVLAVAEAIAYAHAQRVIHRDLKPHNILVGDFGETVVIDWGIARELDGGGEGEASSEIVGTPAYMAPEQARGGAVDERTDVYALGAILHHLLAGHAPYRAPEDSAVSASAMRARVLAGPPASVASLVEGVPADLLTIVAKAMARAPGDRYATAADVAAELRRFQTGQLVAEHRYTLGQLVRRWLKKHRVAVAVGGVALVVLAVVGAISVKRIVDEQRRAERARGLAEAHRAEAEELIDFMLFDLKDRLQPIGKLELLASVATRAEAYYQQRAASQNAAEIEHRARSLVNLGEVLEAQGDVAGALARYRTALAVAGTTAATARDRAVIHQHIGSSLIAQGDAPAALVEYRRALELSEAAAAAEPDNDKLQRNVSIGHERVGNVLLDQGDVAGAMAAYRRSLAIAEPLATRHPDEASWQRDVAITRQKIGQVLYTQGDDAGALAEFRAALEIDERVVARHPDDAGMARTLGISHEKVGEALLAQGDLAGAQAAFDKTVAIAKVLAERDPANAGWQEDLSHSLRKLSNVLLDRDDAAGALVRLDEATAIDEGLVARDPMNADWERSLSVDLGNRVEVLLALGRAADAAASARRALAILERLAGKDPSNVRWQRGLASSHGGLADALQAGGDLAGARTHYGRALAIMEPLAAGDPGNPQWQRDIAGLRKSLDSLQAR